MTRPFGRAVGRLICVAAAGLFVALGLASTAPAGATVSSSGIGTPSPPITLPPVTVPPISLPGVAAPPAPVPTVTVPPLVDNALPPSVGDVLDDLLGDTVGTVNGTFDALTGAVPKPPPTGPGTSPPWGGGPGGGTPGGGTSTGGSTGRAPSPRSPQIGAASVNGARVALGGRAAGEQTGAPLTAAPAPVAATVELPPLPTGPIDEAVKADARRFGWPLLIGGLILAFLAFQNRADRHERKLADAPLDQGERLRFR